MCGVRVFSRGITMRMGMGVRRCMGRARERHVIAKAPRTAELDGSIRAVVPVYDPADAFTVEALAVLLVRIERSEAALAQSGGGGGCA